MRVDRLLASPTFTTDGTAFALSRHRALHRSQDSGQTWHDLPMEPGEVSLSMEFGNDGIVAATTGHGPAEELHLSRDGGATWEPVGPTPGGSHITTLSLAPLYERWQVAFAFAEDGRLYRTVDGGATWSAVLQAQIAPSEAQIAYGPETDGGRLVILLARPRYDPIYNTATGFIPAEPPPPGGQIFRSDDGGHTWQPWPASLDGIPTALAAVPGGEDGLTLLVGMADGRVVYLPVATPE
jgi:photosystem II stability/assembly factor-like uncharacterized protein